MEVTGCAFQMALMHWWMGDCTFVPYMHELSLHNDARLNLQPAP